MKFRDYLFIVGFVLIALIVLCIILIIIVIFAAFVSIMLLLSLPVLFSPDYQYKQAMHVYEIEQSILSVLRMARMRAGYSDGWMTCIGIVEYVQSKIEKKTSFHECLTVLNVLVKRGVVMEKDVPCFLIADYYDNIGYQTAYKLNNDSYFPKKPHPRKKYKRKNISVLPESTS